MTLTRKSKIILVIVALFAISLTVLIWEPWEPRYQGKKLEYWLSQIVIQTKPNIYIPKNNKNYSKIFKSFGSPIVPQLLDDLSAKPSWVERNVIPTLRKQKLIPVNYRNYQAKRYQSYIALRHLDGMAKPALPRLYKMMETNFFAAMLIIEIGREEAIPSFIELLNSTSSEITFYALISFVYSNANRPFSSEHIEDILPAVCSLLAHSNSDVRDTAATTLTIMNSNNEMIIDSLKRAVSIEKNSITKKVMQDSLTQCLKSAGP